MPDHLPREEIVYAGACSCPACGGSLRHIGADVTETLDYVPGRFKVVSHVRAAFSCRACESVVQTPAPHHAIARGRAGAGLLAHILVSNAKRDVMAAAALHGDDTPVAVLAPGSGRTKSGRFWVYVHDARPHRGKWPPAPVFFYSPDRKA